MLTVHERRAKITALASHQGHASVAELAQRFAVTPETIRRDLKHLESSGVVHRVHGGAVSSTTLRADEQPYWVSEKSHSVKKQSIARAALKFIPRQSGSIFLDAGTTTAVLARLLSTQYHGQRWTVVTNSVPAGTVLSTAGFPGVNLLGGIMRAYTQAIVGDEAVSTLKGLRADVAMMGTNAMSPHHGLSTPDPAEAAVKRAMIASANKVVVLCDSSKFEQDYLVTFADLKEIDVVVTDAHASAHFLSTLHNNNIQVVIS